MRLTRGSFTSCKTFPARTVGTEITVQMHYRRRRSVHRVHAQSLVFLLLRTETLGYFVRERRLNTRKRGYTKKDDRDENEQRNEQREDEARCEKLVSLQDTSAAGSCGFGTCLKGGRSRGLARMKCGSWRTGVDDQVVREDALNLVKFT